jgi:hypothetical protein
MWAMLKVRSRNSSKVLAGARGGNCGFSVFQAVNNTMIYLPPAPTEIVSSFEDL